MKQRVTVFVLLALTLFSVPALLAQTDPQALESPAWLDIELTEVNTGEPFTLADFPGKTIYIEPMATWCPKCRAQQQVVRDDVLPAFAESDDVLFLSLSVGENIADADLAAYSEREGFDWMFAIASPEMLSELVASYGRGVVTPPSTPHFFVRPDLSVTELWTGSHSGEEILAQIEEAAAFGAEATPEATAEAAAASAAELAEWQTMNLVNARTGETFTFADFLGKTVYVEPMATWCSQCRAQQQTVRDRVIPELGNPDNFVFLSLSVENIPDEQLAQYAERERFDWNFAVAPPNMLTALVDQFGRGVLTAPSTPHFIIAPDGTVSELSTGRHLGPEILEQLAAAQEA